MNDVSQLAAEKTLCSRILGEIMLNPDPTTDAVKRAGSAERFVKALQRSDPQGGAQADAANILEAALSLIYHKDSVLHALVSIYLDAYTSLDVDDFRLWLKSQQLIQRSVLIPISPCRADDKQDSANGEFQRRLNIDLPPTIKLTRSIGGPALTGNLRHLVIVGNADAPDNLQIVSRATTKYCDKRHLFPVQSGAAFDSDSSSRIGCVRETIYNLDSWIILFCNPEDCKSADKEATVMATIANDPDVRAHVLGQDISKAGARGPYQIEIESPTRN